MCATHGGSAPQVRQRAQERLLQAVDPVAAELVRIALEGESEADRLRACQAVLDRAGLPKAERLQLDARTELVQERQRLLALMFPDEREGEPEPEEAEGEARIAPVDAERNGEVEPTEL